MLGLAGALPLIVLLGAWEAFGDVDSPYYPIPSSWWDAVAELHQQGELISALGATVKTFALALAAATVLGSTLGLAIGISERVQALTSPLIEFCRTMPPAAVIPVAALLIGLGQVMAVVVVVFAAVWPIVLNIAAAVRSLHPVLLDTARTLGLRRSSQLRTMFAPAIVPGLMVGIRVATPLCVIVTLLVEMLTGARGIGSLLIQAQQGFYSAQAFGLLVVVGVLGFVVNTTVMRIERRALRAWPPRVGVR